MIGRLCRFLMFFVCFILLVVLIRAMLIVVLTSTKNLGLGNDQILMWAENGYFKASMYLVVPGLFFLVVSAKRAKKIVHGIYHIISPVVLFFILTAVSSQKYQLPDDSLPRPSDAYDSSAYRMTNYYIFLFDEWSYSRTFHRDDFETVFPNISKLKSVSCCYHNAYSPSIATHRALPSVS